MLVSAFTHIRVVFTFDVASPIQTIARTHQYVLISWFFIFRPYSVAWVRYPGLPEHESHERAKQYFRPGLFGPVLSFGVKGGRKGEEKGYMRAFRLRLSVFGTQER